MRCWLVLAVLALLGLTPSSLQAAPAGKEGESEVIKIDRKKLPATVDWQEVKKAEYKEEKKGIDIFKGALDLSIWTTVVFLILFFVLSKYAWGPILRGMEARERNIQQAVIDAQAAREESAKVRRELQEQIAEANENARQIRDQARHAAEKAAADEIARARAELQAERERLVRDVETDKDQALQAVWQQAVSLATLISAKAVGRALGEDDHRRLLDESLRDFRRAAEERNRGSSTNGQP